MWPGARNDVAPHQVGQTLVEGLHAHTLAGLDGGIHLGDLVLADEVADGRRADHDLVGRHAPGAVLGLQQGLRDDRPQGFGHHRADHVLFAGDVDDTVDRFGGGRGVQGAEHQVAGLGGGEGARRMVSRSRSSPTRITSGSSRRAERRAALKDWVSRATLSAG